MKKTISILMLLALTLTMLAGFTVSVGAEEGSYKLKVYGVNSDAEPVLVNSYTDLEKGWDEAMALAADRDALSEKGFLWVTVDLLTDWESKNGDFTSNDSYDHGFTYDTISVPEDAVVVLNLNGNKIDRKLTDYRYNGEVICVHSDATLIINGGADAEDSTVGTITGGYSCNGAGGIHIHDKGSVVLNNVSVSGNFTEDDDGAGIGLYNGASLIVNGGEISNNTLTGSKGAFFSSVLGLTIYDLHGAGVYVKDATASFNNVTFSGNKALYGNDPEKAHGDVISARNSSVTMDNCTVTENAHYNGKDTLVSYILYMDSSNLEIKNSSFYNNGTFSSKLFFTTRSTVKIENTEIYNNPCHILSCSDDSLTLVKSKVHDNGGFALNVNTNSFDGYFRECEFNNNATYDEYYKAIEFLAGPKRALFEDCDMGNSTYKNKDYATFTSTLTASIFSNGPSPLFVSIVSLALAIISFVMVMNLKNNSKKKK